MSLVKWNRFGWPSIFEDEPFQQVTPWRDLMEAPGGIDIYETDDAVVVEAQVPGIKKEESVDIAIEGNVLTINAKNQESEEDKDKKKVVYKCTRQTAFTYTTSLPRLVDASKAEATVEDGVVKVTIPKAEAEKPKKVTVKKKS